MPWAWPLRAAAAAPAVGEEAVTASKTRTELRYAEQVQESRAVRFVAGRAFTAQGTVTTPDGRTLDPVGGQPIRRGHDHGNRDLWQPSLCRTGR